MEPVGVRVAFEGLGDLVGVVPLAGQGQGDAFKELDAVFAHGDMVAREGDRGKPLNVACAFPEAQTCQTFRLRYNPREIDNREPGP